MSVRKDDRVLQDDVMVAAMEVDASKAPTLPGTTTSSEVMALEQLSTTLEAVPTALQWRPGVCGECGATSDRASKCRGCKELVCQTCALLCDDCGRSYCTLFCGGFLIDMPTIEQQRNKEVPGPVQALNCSRNITCKRCVKRQQREGREAVTTTDMQSEADSEDISIGRAGPSHGRRRVVMDDDE